MPAERKKKKLSPVSVKVKDGYKTIRILGIKFKMRDYSEQINRLEQRVSELEQIKYAVHNLPYEMAGKNYPVPNILGGGCEVLDMLINGPYSMARFGDGEFMLMLKTGYANFQHSNDKLAERLKQVLCSKNKNLLIGLPDVFGDLSGRNEDAQKYWRRLLYTVRPMLYPYFDFSKKYIDSCITRPYMTASDRKKKTAQEHFRRFKKIWQGKDVVIVEGDKTRMGVGNDLFDEAASVKRILCPAENAFDKYDDILALCQKQSKKALFLIALGPTATVLAYDLTVAGYRALDVGHLDIEYEWFKAQATHKIKVSGKYVNEAVGGNEVLDCRDENYLQQIIGKIEN